MMANINRAREALTVVTLCLFWYIISSSSNVVGKFVLIDFPFPMTVTMVQLFAIVLFSGPAFDFWGIRKGVEIPKRYYLRVIVPLAFAKFFTTVFSHISLWKVPVSYAHTVKATLPLFTVVLSWLLLGEKQTLKVYASLVLIIAGVSIATLTELSFNLVGLVSALLSTGLISVQHIYSKQVMKETGIHHLRLLQTLGKLAFFMFLPVWIVTDGWSLLTQPIHEADGVGGTGVASGWWRIGALLCVDGGLAWVQNVVAFSVLSLVAPLTYAVASCAKRAAVIAASLVLLGNPVTPANVLGMLLACAGVAAYNMARLHQRQAATTTPILPTHHQTHSLNNNHIHKNLLFSSL